jgi:hypothetical protein
MVKCVVGKAGKLLVRLFAAASMLTTLFGSANAMSDTKTVNDMFNKTRTVCIGRFLIDVPETAQVVLGPSAVPYELVLMEGKGRHLPEVLAKRLEVVEEEKKYADPELKGKDSMVGKVLDGVMPGQKLVFGVSRGSGGFYEVQSYVPVGDDLFMQSAQALPEEYRYMEIVHKLNAVAKRLRSRKEDYFPTEPGVCVEGGFIAESHRPGREWVTMGIRFREFPDIHMSFSMTNKSRLVQSDALEPRLRQAEKDARLEGHGDWYSRITVFRQGPRTIGKWVGFEALARKPPLGQEKEAYEFAFLSQGEPNNPLLPVLDIKLDSGVSNNIVGAVKTGISDDEAMALWDAVIGTLRVRPTVVPAQKAPPLAIGAVAMAGQCCPQEGWWEYLDHNEYEVVDGRRRYFKEGEKLPQVVLRKKIRQWFQWRERTISCMFPQLSVWTLHQAEGKDLQGK